MKYKQSMSGGDEVHDIIVNDNDVGWDSCLRTRRNVLRSVPFTSCSMEIPFYVHSSHVTSHVLSAVDLQMSAHRPNSITSYCLDKRRASVCPVISMMVGPVRPDSVAADAVVDEKD